MELLRRKILEEAKGIGDDTVKADMFLNHRIDTELLLRWAKPGQRSSAGRSRNWC